MLSLLLPDLYVASLTSISTAGLRDRDIRALIVDLDNTVTEWNGSSLRPEVQDWFAALAAEGFSICLTSNNKGPRVEALATRLGVPYLLKAGKPRRRAFLQAMDLMASNPAETAVVGDQVFTDVLGGKRLGLYTVLVMPISNKEFIGTRAVRLVERLLIGRFLALSDDKLPGAR